MGFFRVAHRGGGEKAPLPKICHTYPTMMKPGTVIPYLRKIQYFDDVNILILMMSAKMSVESLKIVLIKEVIILMMSAKMAAPGLFKIMVFRNKSYYVIISVHDGTNKILSHDSNYIVDVVM